MGVHGNLLLARSTFRCGSLGCHLLGAARWAHLKLWPRAEPGSGQGTCGVGSFAAGKSPFGLHDMAGNVWEWTSTAICPYTKKNCAEAARVYRGGSWNIGDPSYLRASDRVGNARAIRFDFLGFRCAR